MTELETAIQEAVEAVEVAQGKVKAIWEIKKAQGKEAGRYARVTNELRKIKKTVAG